MVGAIKKMRKGGWIRTGATIDPTQGQAPTYSAHGGMSFAELLVAGANAGLKSHAVSKLLGIPESPSYPYGMPMGTPMMIRMPGSKKAHKIWKNDVGSGQGGDTHYTVDLHQRIADVLGWGGNADVEVAKVGTSAAAGADDSGPSPGQKRLKQRTGIIEKFRKAVQGAKTKPGKQSALWELIQGYGKFGHFDKKEKVHVLDAVRSAAGRVNPTANLSQLQKLAGYLEKNVKVSGAAGTNEDFMDHLMGAKGRKSRKAAKARRKVLKRLSKKGMRYPEKGDILSLDGWIAKRNEQIEIAEQLGSAESGPGGSGLTDAEAKEQIQLVTDLFWFQKGQSGKVNKSIPFVERAREYFARMVKRSAGKNSPLNWKHNAFKSALTGAKDALSGLTQKRTDLTGITGKGGDLFATSLKLKELGVTTTVEGASKDARDSEIADLLRQQLSESQKNLAISQSQMPIFQQFMPKYHTGGVIPGITEQPIMAKGGEGVFTPDQMAAMGGGSPTVVIEIAPGAGVDPDMIDARINGQLVKTVRRVRGGNAGASKYNTAGLR